MSQISVQLVRRHNPEDIEAEPELSVKVSLTSQARPGLQSHGYLPLDCTEDQVGTLGGALAEYQCLKYADRHNPSDAAHAAVRAFIKLKAKGDAMNRKVEVEQG